MEQDPTWVFNILWTDEAHFSLHGEVNNHNCRIWATSNPREYTQKPLHSPKVTAWCGFKGSFIIEPFFFETQCPVNEWITETVPMAPRSPDLTPADFWLWGYLKSRVYLSGPSSLLELKDAIRREVSSIHPDMLHSAVAGFVTRLECLLLCGGGHVEHILSLTQTSAFLIYLNQKNTMTEILDLTPAMDLDTELTNGMDNNDDRHPMENEPPLPQDDSAPELHTSPTVSK
ncbi:uncharacterized protein TNCV_2116661 [Trichonephila clavipes]|nr:uncharacterized protein TNCV_2116661 [Trichonephila clavipes]